MTTIVPTPPALPLAPVPPAAFIARKAIVLFEEAIMKKTVDASSPISVIKCVLDILVSIHHGDVAQQKQQLVDVIAKICAGVDGVAGTADDLVPPSTVAMLKFIVENDLVGNTVTFVPASVQKGCGCVPRLFALKTKVGA